MTTMATAFMKAVSGTENEKTYSRTIKKIKANDEAANKRYIDETHKVKPMSRKERKEWEKNFAANLRARSFFGRAKVEAEDKPKEAPAEEAAPTEEVAEVA